MSRRLFDQLSSWGRSPPRLEDLPEFFARMRQTQSWKEHNEQAFIAEVRFAVRWVDSGQIVFDLTHSMAAMFAITTSPPIDWHYAPHEAFVIKLPRRFLPVPGALEPEYTYIYVTKEKTLLIADYDSTAIMWIEYGENVSRDDLELADAAALSRSTAEAAAKCADEDVLAAAIQHGKNARPALSDEEQRTMAKAYLQSEQERLRQLAEAAKNFDATLLGQRVLVNRFVSNVIAYVTEHRPSSHPSTKSVSPRYEMLQPPPEVIIDRAFRDAAVAVVSSVIEGSVVGIRRALAHHVRGHWRDQACGAGRSQRKRIWIMPHRRGEESLGSVVRRVEHLDVSVNLN